jgi:hypothetical protein
MPRAGTAASSSPSTTTVREITCDVKPATTTSPPLREHATTLFLVLLAFVSPTCDVCLRAIEPEPQSFLSLVAAVSLPPSLSRSGLTFAPPCVLRSPSCCDWASTRAPLCRNPSQSCPLPSFHLAL